MPSLDGLFTALEDWIATEGSRGCLFLRSYAETGGDTPEVAAAVGFAEYRLRGALMRLRGAASPLVIDLLEWQSPSDPETPYPRLNHLGIARIALDSSDLDADLSELRAEGVEIVGEPATVVWNGRPGSRFVCFKDPDGTVLELVQALNA